MPEQPDVFRDFGILPDSIDPPPQTVRAFFPGGQIFGQYLATCMMSGFGLGIGALLLFTLNFPVNIIAAAVIFAVFGYIVYRVTRNDYAWIELDGRTIRAKHLYTRRIVERPIEEVEDLLTLVFQVQTAATILSEAWLGRIRGIMIRFHDQCTRLQVSRSDPAMKNAKELIQAIVYRMSEQAEVDFEVIDLEGQPLIRRIFWKDERSH